MIHLYIDTNVYLTFFHLTKEDLRELKKVYILIKTGQIKLYLPQQTYDEFNRNREVKIADALKKLREEKLQNQFPQFCKGYPEFDTMKQLIKDYETAKDSLITKLTEDIFKENLEADKIIQNLFKIASRYEMTEALIETAKSRYDLGRPPGKNKSYGDAINWETLLQNVDKFEDLYIITEDKDYYSEIDFSYFNRYLINEWTEQKKSGIFHYRRMSEFFKEKFPTIVIASDYEKSLLIDQLAKSGSFATSRSTLRKLSKYEDYPTHQLKDIITALISNNQITYIKDDLDIKEIINNMITLNIAKIPPELKRQLDGVYKYTSLIKY